MVPGCVDKSCLLLWKENALFIHGYQAICKASTALLLCYQSVISTYVLYPQNLTWRFGICLYSDGRYNEAEVSFVEVAERRKKVLGEEHPDRLTRMANLASTYRIKEGG